MSTTKTANQHNLTALIIVTALLLVAAKLGYNKREEERAVKQEHMKKIEQNDAQIKHLFQTVDSLQKMAVKQTRDSLAKHPEFAYLEQNRAHIDSLRSANNKLFERAYNAAQKSSVFAVAQMNESLFSDFGNVPAVKRAKWPYYKNKKEIQDYDKRRQAVQHIPAAVRAHFDTATARQVHKLQKEINNLLMRKDSLMSQKVK